MGGYRKYDRCSFFVKGKETYNHVMKNHRKEIHNPANIQEKDKDYGHSVESTGKYSSGFDPLEIPGSPDLGTPPQQVIEAELESAASGCIIGVIVSVLRKLVGTEAENR